MAVKLIFSVLESYNEGMKKGLKIKYLPYLFIQIDSVFAIDVCVLVRQPSAVDNFEEEMKIFANKLIRTVHKLIIFLSVFFAFLVARSNFNLLKSQIDI